MQHLFTQADGISLRLEYNPVECVTNDEYRQLSAVVELHVGCNFFADLSVSINTEADG